MSKRSLTKEQEAFLVAHILGRGNQDLADLINEEFSINWNRLQVKNYKQNHKLGSSGLTGYYTIGSTPQNKGKKGEYFPGCEKGWFQKGRTPTNHKPIGSERIDSKDGYTLIKTAEPGTWELNIKCCGKRCRGRYSSMHLITGKHTNLRANAQATTDTVWGITSTWTEPK